jgi:ribosomal protein S18 acetylase RimI-like enzyme
MSREAGGQHVPVDVTMRRRTLVGVPAMPQVGEALEVRRARVDDVRALASLLGSAFEGETWDAAGVERELLSDRTVRAVLVIAAGRRLVSTASLQVRPESPGSGWVRWVATDPGWRRNGLAHAVVVGVLELAAQAGCQDAYLETRTDRLAAIALYMQLGFEPLVREDCQDGSAVSGSHIVPREVWTRVTGALLSQAGCRKP